MPPSPSGSNLHPYHSATASQQGLNQAVSPSGLRLSRTSSQGGLRPACAVSARIEATGAQQRRPAQGWRWGEDCRQLQLSGRYKCQPIAVLTSETKAHSGRHSPCPDLSLLHLRRSWNDSLGHQKRGVAISQPLLHAPVASPGRRSPGPRIRRLGVQLGHLARHSPGLPSPR